MFKIKSRAIANPDFDKSYIFDRFSSRRFFHVGGYFCKKKLKILDFLVFEGIHNFCTQGQDSSVVKTMKPGEYGLKWHFEAILDQHT